MTDYPLLPTPKPTKSTPPRGGGGGLGIKTPGRISQGAKHGQIFQRLHDILERRDGPVVLRDDPTGIAPERALVFELAGSIDKFISTVSRIPGLDFLGIEDRFFEPDTDFHHVDNRQGTTGEIRKDKMISGRLYMTMPDVKALRQLISLWNQYEKGKKAPRGFAPLFQAFEHLKVIRHWGPTDRLPNQTIEYLTKKFDGGGTNFISIEVDLWYPRNKARRESGKIIFEEA